MGKPAARITDMHVCPMFTALVPHVGGPIVAPSCPTVMVGKMPAAGMGSVAICVGPPDSIILGSATVLIGKKPAARMGDSSAHGGAIVGCCPTVLIGG
ncbi:MAG: PAAR domain-containing protein [Pseudomonadales bacterium]|nr:PAAR domain-containing protein [Pseudomonadales bacterium]